MGNWSKGNGNIGNTISILHEVGKNGNEHSTVGTTTMAKELTMVGGVGECQQNFNHEWERKMDNHQWVTPIHQ